MGPSSAIAEELPGMPRDAQGPVFAAPWQARALATLGEVRARGEADTGERYYEHWLVALERIALRKELLDDGSLRTRRAQWQDAARRTPHGQPIVLAPD